MGSRLLEFAPSYYELASFPDGETKRALLRSSNKKPKGDKPQDGERKKKKGDRPQDGEHKKKKLKTEY